MSYFNNFPVILDYEIQGQTYNGVDITRRTNVVAESKNNPANYIEYRVQEGETPEIIADRIYDDVGLYWVIMMFNDRFDVSSEWPLDSHSFERFVQRKYGSSVHRVRHYVSASSGAVVGIGWPEYDRQPVTNYEYELGVNDALRDIKVPTPQCALQIAAIHRRLIKQ